MRFAEKKKLTINPLIYPQSLCNIIVNWLRQPALEFSTSKIHQYELCLSLTNVSTYLHSFFSLVSFRSLEV